VQGFCPCRVLLFVFLVFFVLLFFNLYHWKSANLETLSKNENQRPSSKFLSCLWFALAARRRSRPLGMSNFLLWGLGVVTYEECWWSQSCIYETSSFTLSELWLDALKCKAWIFEISQSSHDGQLFSYLIVQWHADQNPQTEHCCSVGHSNLWGCCCANLPRASRWLGEVFSHEGSMA
jgi:hypothetical protein